MLLLARMDGKAQMTNDYMCSARKFNIRLKNSRLQNLKRKMNNKKEENKRSKREQRKEDRTKLLIRGKVTLQNQLKRCL